MAGCLRCIARLEGQDPSFLLRAWPPCVHHLSRLQKLIILKAGWIWPDSLPPRGVFGEDGGPKGRPVAFLKAFGEALIKKVPYSQAQMGKN